MCGENRFTITTKLNKLKLIRAEKKKIVKTIYHGIAPVAECVLY